MTDGTKSGRFGVVAHVVPLVLYLGYIFVMGAIPLDGPPMGVSDKTAHFIAFGLMVPLFYRALRYLRPALGRGRVLVASVLFASAAGALLELVQAFIPYRSSELLDWVADTLGAILTAAVLAALAALAARLGLLPQSRTDA